MDIKEALTKYYTTLYALAFSPCEKYIAASSSFGKIAIFNLVRLLNSESDVQLDQEINIQAPIYSFQAKEGPIFALASNSQYLISAGDSWISGWCWKDILNKNNKLSWQLAIPKDNAHKSTEVNAMALVEKDGVSTLYAGCGDNNIYVFDLESQKLKLTFKGHSNYIHCLNMCGEAQGNEICFSGGEDGLVLAWDSRNSKDPIHKIEPYKNELCHRPNFGKWISCVDTSENGDWMVCGGGPTLSLWHLRSLSCNVTFPTPTASQNCVLFHQDLIVSAGTEAVVNRWGFNGEEESKISTSPFAIYSLMPSTSAEKKILCVAGSSTTIDICSHFKYKDFSLYFE